MAVQRRVNWVSQQRVDVPDMRSIESASSNDFDQLLQTLIVSDLPGYVLRGFDLVMTGAIGGAASGLTMNVANAALLHPFASQSGTYFVVPNGTPVQVLNSAINTQVNGAFTPNSENFVGIDYTRSVDDLTDAQVYLWDPTDNDETTSVLPRAIILNFQIVISTSTWANNVLPVCTVTTDAGNNVISIEDNRPLLYRLGTAGTSQPNPYYTYPWDAQPEGRTENPYISTSNAVNPFQGGDKMLFTQKDETDAIKSILKEIKGSAFWYTFGSTSVANVNLSFLFFDTDGSVMTMRGKFIHSQVTPGMLTWTGQLNIQSISGPLEFIIAPGSVELLDQEVAYIYLVRDQNFQPLNSFTFVNGSSVINASGLVAGIAAGDWVRFFSDSITDYQQVMSVSGSTITLVNPYIGSSATGIALRSQGTYTMTVAEPDSVPADNNAFWIAKRADNGSITATIEASPLGAVRSAGITTFTTTLPHGINAGQGIQANGVADPTFNQFFEVLTVPTANSVTVENPGLDSSSGGGTLSSTATIYLRGIGEVSQGESSSDDSSALEALLQYTGAPYAGATQPQYGSTNFVTQGIDLTDAISELDSALGAAVGVADQDRNLKLIEGGTWSYNGGTGVLSWSADAYIQIPGQADTLNTIAAGSVTLAAGQVAYVVVNRTGTPPLTVAPVVAAITAVPANSNVVIFARRQPITNSVIVGTHSFALFDGEASTLDGALGVIDDYFSEIRMTAVRPNNTRILISDADVTMLTGETRSQRISSFLLNFAGAQIDFQTGDVYEADGSTPLGIDFTPVIPAAGMWRWFTIVIIPDMLGSDNRMVGDILVLPAAADGASAAAAPRSIFTGSGIALGQVVINSVDGTTVTAIPQANIVQLGVGSGSGSGGGSLIKINLYDGVDTSLPSSSPATIDNVTVTNGMLVVFTQLVSGNNEVYQASVVGGSSSPNLPNPIVMQISNANPYSGGNLETVSAGVATPIPADDAYFVINGSMITGSGNPAIAGFFNLGGVFSDMTSGADWKDQPFVAAVSGPLGSVTIRSYWDATVGSGNLNLSIWTDDAGVPGTRISSIAPINTANLSATATGSQTPSTITTSFSYGALVSGQTYHLVIDPTNVSFASTLRLYVSSSGATNPDLLTSTNSGATWAPNASTNANFSVTTSSGLIAQNTFGVSSTPAINITTTSNVAAQPFTPNITQEVAAIMYTMSRATGVLGGTFSVGLYNDSAGSPGSLINSVNVNASTLTNAGDEINYQITQLTTSSNLVVGTQYWILWNFANVTGLGGSGIIFLGTGSCAATQPPELSLSSDGGSTYPIIGSTSAQFAVLAGSRGSGDTAVGQYNNGTQYNAVTGTNYATSQPFIASASGPVVSAGIDMYVGNGSTYSGTVTVAIYNDNGSGQPGTLLTNIASSANNIFNNASVQGIFLPFNFSTGSVVSGTLYHLVTSFAHTTLASGTFEIRIASDTSSLTSPNAIESTDTGSTFPTTLMDGGSPVNQHYFVAINSNRIDTNSTAFPGAVGLRSDNTTNLTTTWWAQPFTAASSVILGSVKIPLRTIGTPGALSGNIRISVYSNSGGVPGLRLTQYSYIDASTLQNYSQNYSVPQSLGLTGGTSYFIVLDPSLVSGMSGINDIAWDTYVITPTSVPPSAVHSLNSGSTWSSGGGGVTQIFDAFQPFTGGGSTPVIFAENLSINSTYNATTNTTSLGQTFMATSTAALNSAVFQLSIASASPPNSGNLTVKIYQDNGSGQPGTLIETSSNINSATLTTTPTAYTFNYSGLNNLTNGTLYHAIVDTSGLSGTSVPGSISWTPQPEFASPYQPATGDMLVVTQGLQFANQVTEFNGTTWVVNPFYRSFNGLDFWESSSIITSTAPNNTATPIFTVTALGSENIIINASILRSGNKETFTLWLTNNGTIAEVSGGGSDTAPTGVTWSATLSGGMVSLVANVDNSGGDATVKYITTRWSDGGAGPTGLPSYSPVLPGGVAASAFTMSDGSSTPYNCAAPFNVSGMTNISLDFSYVMGMNGGSTVGALDVYVNGQRISRYVSSAVTPPSAGTLYTEISTTQIQFTTNIMSTPLTVEIIKRS